MTISVGTAQRALKGQSVCGDSILVLRGERTTISLIDGLGHGPLAAEAAQVMCAFVTAHADDSLENIMRGASQALIHTRGAAGGIMRIDENSLRMEFVGVGNIEIQAVSEKLVRPFCVPGIIGQRIRKILCFDYVLSPNDVLAMYTDGVSTRFDLNSYASLEVEKAASTILEAHGKDHDDASCIVIRC